MPSIGLTVYRAATRVLTPLAPAILWLRARRGKEDEARRAERLGFPCVPRPAGPLLWLHGASIGEGLSLLPLSVGLRAQGFAVLLTTGTRAGAAVIAPRLPSGIVHQYAPLDLPAAVARFLTHWRPDALLLAESELWPNLLYACTERGIPAVVVGARMSARSHRRWRRVPAASQAVFGTLALCLAQSREDAGYFEALGARDVRVTGSLKSDGVAPPADPAILADLRAAIGSRPVLLAASTHAKDEAPALRAHRALRDTVPDLLTIVVPRDPSRATAVETIATRCGLRTVRRTRGDPLAPDVDVLVADTFGEMGVWLRLATIAVIGKTFGQGGGQTPLEAVRCGVPIVHGPSVHAFSAVFQELDRRGGALPATTATLAEAVGALIADPPRRRTMAAAASAVGRDLSGGTARTLRALAPLLAAIRPSRAA